MLFAPLSLGSLVVLDILIFLATATSLASLVSQAMLVSNVCVFSRIQVILVGLVRVLSVWPIAILVRLASLVSPVSLGRLVIPV